MDDQTNECLRKLTEDVESLRKQVCNHRRQAWQNFLYGVLRGLGFTLGFSVLGAVALVILSKLMVENIPVIGGFLAEVRDAMQRVR